MERKISLSHMAFYRGWLNGLSLREVADLYLETGLDLSRARSTLVWIQDTLCQAVLRHGRHGEARLLRLRLFDRRGGAYTLGAVPTIEDFRAQLDPGELWSDDELQVRYRKAYPWALERRSLRRAALLARQAATLTWLEQWLATAPTLADPLGAWLDESLVAYLAKARVATVGDLKALMINRGYHWYAAVPALGRVKAARLVQWVQGFAGSWGSLPATVLNPPRALPPGALERLLAPEGDPSGTPTIAPLEELVVPRRVPDPSGGVPLIDVVDDRGAVTAWLYARAGSTQAHRAYRKEAERLLLWVHLERGRGFGQLTEEDAAAYRDFLLGLGRTRTAAWPFRISQSDWCAPRHTSRQHARWRPFDGPLTPQSVVYALSVVRILFAWLAAVAYVPRDPWATLAPPTVQLGPSPYSKHARLVSVAAWEGLQVGVAGMSSPGRERAEAMLWLAVVTGLGQVDLATATTDRLYTVQHPDGGTRWMLKVPGRKAVSLPDAVMQRLTVWWESAGLATDPAALPSGFPLIGRLDPRQRHIPLTPTGVSLLMKRLFAIGRAACRRAGDFDGAGMLAKASVHWVRRTTGGVSVEASALLFQIQQLLGLGIVTTPNDATPSQNFPGEDSAAENIAQQKRAQDYRFSSSPLRVEE